MFGLSVSTATVFAVLLFRSVAVTTATATTIGPKCVPGHEEWHATANAGIRPLSAVRKRSAGARFGGSPQKATLLRYIILYIRS